MDPTKLSALISQPLLTAVPLLASTQQGLLSHRILPPVPPALSPLTFSLFLKLLLHRHHRRNQTGTGSIVQQRQEKKIIKKAGDLKKTRIISQIEWENLTCLITTENKHCADAQASDWHAGCFE